MIHIEIKGTDRVEDTQRSVHYTAIAGNALLEERASYR